MAEARYAVLWDMDGTLVDTAELHFRAWKDCCRELGPRFHAGRLLRYLRSAQSGDFQDTLWR